MVRIAKGPVTMAKSSAHSFRNRSGTSCCQIAKCFVLSYCRRLCAFWGELSIDTMTLSWVSQEGTVLQLGHTSSSDGDMLEGKRTSNDTPNESQLAKE